MPDTFRVGPALLFYGNPGTLNGTDMTYLGLTKGDVSVTPNVRIALGMADQTGMTPRSDAAYRVGLAPIVSAPLLDEAKTILQKLLPGSSVVTAAGKTSLAFGSGFSKIAEADIGTLAIIPVDEKAQGTNGIDAVNGIWLPAAISNQFGSLVFRLPDEGEDSAFNPHETQFAGLRRVTNWGLGGALTEAARTMFIGPPGAHGLTWYLPAVTL